MTYSSEQSSLDALLSSYSDLFQDEPGELRGIATSIALDSDAKPQFYRARPLPFTLHPVLEAEHDKLVSRGTIEPVKHSDWATPIVSVMKSNRSVHICGDYKLTVNKALRLEH